MEGEKKRERGEGGVGWIKRREKQRKVEGKGEMKWRDRRKERKTREREGEEKIWDGGRVEEKERWRSVCRLPLVSLLDECESGVTVCFRFLSTVREI